MVSPEEAIDRVNEIFGSQDRGGVKHRALHAKGAFYEGTFTATPAATALCRAGHLQGEPVPVWVRWSNGGGHPRIPDSAPDVRGMAVSFRLPDGTATDLVAQTSPRFPVRRPEDFLELVECIRKPWRFPLFVARHPESVVPLAAVAKARAIVPPHSYAEVRYFPIHAYRWTAGDGGESWVRYRLVPRDPQRPDGTFKGRDRLRDELLARLAAGPVRFTLEVQVAGPGEDPHDPMSVWKSGWFDAGSLEVTAPDPLRETEGEVVVFDPSRVVDGIGLSDDPILLFRPAAYSASVKRRV